MMEAIFSYAEHHMKDIILGEKTIFEMVLNNYKDQFPKSSDAKFLSEYLIAYYQERCKLMKRDIDNGDKISSHLIDKDNSYSFEYKGKSLFKN